MSRRPGHTRRLESTGDEAEDPRRPAALPCSIPCRAAGSSAGSWRPPGAARAPRPRGSQTCCEGVKRLGMWIPCPGGPAGRGSQGGGGGEEAGCSPRTRGPAHTLCRPPPTRTSHKVEKQCLLKNLEGKSHNSKNSKVECKKRPRAARSPARRHRGRAEGPSRGRGARGGTVKLLDRRVLPGDIVEVPQREKRAGGRGFLVTRMKKPPMHVIAYYTATDRNLVLSLQPPPAPAPAPAPAPLKSRSPPGRRGNRASASPPGASGVPGAGPRQVAARDRWLEGRRGWGQSPPGPPIARGCRSPRPFPM